MSDINGNGQALERAEEYMTQVQARVDAQGTISGEAAIQMLSLYTALAQAQQLERIATALETIARGMTPQ